MTKRTTLLGVAGALLFLSLAASAVIGQESGTAIVDAHYRVPLYVNLGPLAGTGETGTVLTLILDMETTTALSGTVPISTTVRSVTVEVAPDNDSSLLETVSVEPGPALTSTVSGRAAVEPSPAPLQLACRAAYLRAGPGKTYETVGSVDAGTELQIIGQEFDPQGNVWYQLSSEEWIAGFLVCDAPPISPGPTVTAMPTTTTETTTETTVPCEPGLEATFVPAYGTEGTLQGRANCVAPEEYNVAVYIYVEGAGWWTKPSYAEPLTSIQRDRTWSTDIVTGGNDKFATKIAAFLVPVSYAVPDVGGEQALPVEIFDNAAAILELTRSGPVAETSPAAPPATQPEPQPEPQPAPPGIFLTVQAQGGDAWGTVGPESVCNSRYKIALYAKTNHWWVQPYADERRNIRINDDCTWRTTTNNWRQVAAHLVTADYDIEPEVFDESTCPPSPLDPARDPDVLAVACYPR